MLQLRTSAFIKLKKRREMEIPFCLRLLFPSLGIACFLLLSHQLDGKNFKVREIQAKFRKMFPGEDHKGNKYIKWLYSYDDVKDFPHLQRRILDLASEFLIADIKNDVKVIESIVMSFNEAAKTDQRDVLRTFADLHHTPALVEYLTESGFPVSDYSFDELLEMLVRSQWSELKYGRFASDPEFREFINSSSAIRYGFFHYNRIVEIHDILFKERRPAKLVLDLLEMKVVEFKAFSELPIMTDDKTRSTLLSLFKNSPKLSDMFNTLKAFSRYPDAIKCLKLVQNPKKLQKQILIILFPHHVSRGSCDLIINLDLREKVGGWRQRMYGQHDYAVTLGLEVPINVAFFEKAAMSENDDTRDRMTLDWLWKLAHRNKSNTYKVERPEMVKSVINEESQSIIYQMLEAIHQSYSVQVYEDDKIIPELEKEYWDKCFREYARIYRKEVRLFIFLLIPRLYPNRVSRIALSMYLDQGRRKSVDYVETILQEYMLEGDQLELKRHTIESLQDMLGIGIDPSILDDVNCSNFKKFATLAYKKVSETGIRLIEIGKLVQLFLKQQEYVPNRAILEVIKSRIARAYSKNKDQSIIIKFLVFVGSRRKPPFDKLNTIEDVPEYLNSIYYKFDPSEFFQDALFNLEDDIQEVLRQNWNKILVSGWFGMDFLSDLYAVIPSDGSSV